MANNYAQNLSKFSARTGYLPVDIEISFTYQRNWFFAGQKRNSATMRFAIPRIPVNRIPEDEFLDRFYRLEKPVIFTGIAPPTADFPGYSTSIVSLSPLCDDPGRFHPLCRPV